MGRNIVSDDGSRVYLVTNEVAVDFDVLRSLVQDRVSSYGEGS